MKIKRFEVSGLNGRVDFAFNFHEDLNILTGVNGAGKTTALKLLWYTLSGNTVRIRNEIDFVSCYLETDEYSLRMNRALDGRDIGFKFSSPMHEESGAFDEWVHFDSDGDPISDGEDLLRELILNQSSGSIFFPTFRRIEGGYSLGKSNRFRSASGLVQVPRAESTLGSHLEQVSKELSNGMHKFVCSISTEDIAEVLTQRYAQVSEGVNRKYTEFSSQILEGIREWEQGEGTSGNSSEMLLRQIREAANQVDEFRESTLKPFNVLAELVGSLFSYQGVKVKTLALGDAAKAINSEILSAGEKQMLSFLVYNAFSEGVPIFIDEPELSLHPDWQRRLFPMLLRQQASNQFIVSTHSPFIYSKFVDKELAIVADRGE